MIFNQGSFIAFGYACLASTCLMQSSSSIKKHPIQDSGTFTSTDAEWVLKCISWVYRKVSSNFTRIALATVVVCVILTVISWYQWKNASTGRQHLQDDTVYETLQGDFGRAAVVTNAPPCATVGKNILLKGGNAVDAMIAAMLCDGVAVPQSMGIGGGFFMVIFNKRRKKFTSIIARARAPGAATVDMFAKDPTLSQIGGLSVAVPGEMKGYWMAYQKFGGGIPWKELFAPTIELCEKGIPINAPLARVLSLYKKMIQSNEEFKTLFVDPKTGLLLKQNDTYRNLKLARTLRTIAENGGDAFYKGPLAASLVQDIRDNGGIITEQDLLDYETIVEDAYTVRVSYDNITLSTVHPPSSGVILAYIVRILNGLLPSNSELLDTQRMTEALKYGYAVRSELGDPHFVKLDHLINLITADNFVDKIRSEVSDVRTWNDTKHYGSELATAENKGTANLAVLAENGDAVVATSTINLRFGSSVLSKSTGIILNDEMDDFSTPNTTNYFGVEPSPANFIEPHKMPLSSMCPSIIVDQHGDVRLLIGAAGGTKITSAVAIATARILYLNETARQAIDNVWFHHQLLPMVWQYYPEISNEIVRGMQDIGHAVEQIKPSSFAAITAIERRGDKMYANCDRKRPGHVDGY